MSENLTILKSAKNFLSCELTPALYGSGKPRLLVHSVRVLLQMLVARGDVAK